MTDVSDMLRAGLVQIDAAMQRQAHPAVLVSVSRAFSHVATAIEQLEDEPSIKYPEITGNEKAGDQRDEGQDIPSVLIPEPEREWTAWYERSDEAFSVAKDHIIYRIDEWYWIMHGISHLSELLGQDWLPPANHPALRHRTLWERAPDPEGSEEAWQRSPLFRRCMEVCYAGPWWRVRGARLFSEQSSSDSGSDYSPDPSEEGTEDTFRPSTYDENWSTHQGDDLDGQGTTGEQEGVQGEHGSEQLTLSDLHQHGNRARALTEDHSARRFERNHPRVPYAPEVLRRREVLKSRPQVKVNTTTVTASRATPPSQHYSNSQHSLPNTTVHNRDTQIFRANSNMTNTNTPPFEEEEELRLVPPGSENAQPTVRGLIEERKELSEYQAKNRTEERTPVYEYTPKPATTSRIPTLAGASTSTESSPKKKFSDHFTRKATPIEQPSTGPAAPKAKALLGSPMVKSGPSFFRRTSSTARTSKNSGPSQQLFNVVPRLRPNLDSGTSSSEPSPIKDEFKTPATPVRAASVSGIASNTANTSIARPGFTSGIQEVTNRPKPVRTSNSPSLMRKVSNTVMKAVSPVKPKATLEDHPPTPPAKDTPPKAAEDPDTPEESSRSGIVRAPLYRNDMDCTTDETPTPIKSAAQNPQVMETTHRVRSMSGDIVGGCDTTDRLGGIITVGCDILGPKVERLSARAYSPPLDTRLFYSPENSSSAQFVYSPSIYDNVRNSVIKQNDEEFEGVAFPHPSSGGAAPVGQPESPVKSISETLPKVRMMEDYPILLQPTKYEDHSKRVSFTEPTTSDAQDCHETFPAHGDTTEALEFADDKVQKRAANRKSDESAYTDYTLSPLKADFQCPSAKPSPLRIPRRISESLSGAKSLRERYADGQQRGSGLGITTSPDTEHSDGMMAPPNSPVKEQMLSSILRDLIKDLSEDRKSRKSHENIMDLNMSNFSNVMGDVRKKLRQLQDLDPKALSQKVVAMESDMNKIDTIGLAMLEVVEKVDHVEDYLSTFSDRMEDSLVRLAEDVVAKVKEDAEAANDATAAGVNRGLEAILKRVDRVAEHFAQFVKKIAAMEAKVTEKEVGPGLWTMKKHP